MGRDPHVVIAGGGWAGVAAAVELSDHGVKVTLLESAKQLGGRARGTDFGTVRVDNGQHLLIGAYREILRLLARMGARETELFTRTPLLLHLLADAGPVELRAPRHWPAPLHLVWAIVRARGLSPRERVAALRFALHLRLSGFTIERDIPLAALLGAHRQPQRVVEALWEPLCLATLNVPPDAASARLFLHVLRDAFSRHARDSDLLFPRTDLGRLFPERAAKFVRRHGGEIRLGTRLAAIHADAGKITCITTDETPLDATQLVLALPAWEAGDVLAPFSECAPLAQWLRDLPHTPITTVYLRYGPTVSMATPLLGLVGTLAQWVVDRSGSEPGLVAAVISGPGVHMEWERSAVAERVARELSDRLGWPAPQESFVVREKRATFRCAPRVDEERPGPVTPLRNIWLAGDYTDTGYPATLEGAVRSGVECARLVLHDLGHCAEPAP